MEGSQTAANLVSLCRKDWPFILELAWNGIKKTMEDECKGDTFGNSIEEEYSKEIHFQNLLWMDTRKLRKKNKGNTEAYKLITSCWEEQVTWYQLQGSTALPSQLPKAFVGSLRCCLTTIRAWTAEKNATTIRNQQKNAYATKFVLQLEQSSAKWPTTQRPKSKLAMENPSTSGG